MHILLFELNLIIGCSACTKQRTMHPLEAEVTSGAATQKLIKLRQTYGQIFHKHNNLLTTHLSVRQLQEGAAL